MRTPEEWAKTMTWDVSQFELMIKDVQDEAWNEATRLASESATAYITQESVNGGKVAKVNSESILKNLKK